jgi:hypothetical protein
MFGFVFYSLILQIVLPYAKIATIDLIKSESNLDSISIKMLEDKETRDIAEEYYFSYFNNVQGAYDKMATLWQNGREFPLKSRQSIYDTSIPARSLSVDELIENVRGGMVGRGNTITEKEPSQKVKQQGI